jgi:hypothetical protein
MVVARSTHARRGHFPNSRTALLDDGKSKWFSFALTNKAGVVRVIAMPTKHHRSKSRAVPPVSCLVGAGHGRRHASPGEEVR